MFHELWLQLWLCNYDITCHGQFIWRELEPIKNRTQDHYGLMNFIIIGLFFVANNKITTKKL